YHAPLFFDTWGGGRTATSDAGSAVTTAFVKSRAMEVVRSKQAELQVRNPQVYLFFEVSKHLRKFGAFWGIMAQRYFQLLAISDRDRDIISQLYYTNKGRPVSQRDMDRIAAIFQKLPRRIPISDLSADLVVAAVRDELRKPKRGGRSANRNQEGMKFTEFGGLLVAAIGGIAAGVGGLDWFSGILIFGGLGLASLPRAWERYG